MGGGLQPPSGFPSTPGSASEIPPSTPNMGDRGFQHDSPSGSAAGSTMSPGMGGGGEYGYGGTGYALDASRMDLSPEPPNFNNIDYHAPRTDPVPLFVVTRNLSPSTALHVDNPPELTHGHDYSPWTSASDSNYSTPSDMSRNHRYWTHHRSTTSMDWTGNNSLLSPFPPSAGGSSGLDTMAAPYYMTSPFPMTPHLASPAHNTYGNLLDPSLMGGFADDPTHDPFMDTSAHPHHNAHFPHRSSSSVRSPTLQSAPASAQSAETLVTPVPLPHRIDMMANLGRKEMVLEGSDVGIGMLGGGGGSPNWGGSSPGGGGILEGSGLGGLGGCGIGGITLVAPLPRSVRNAIPSYLDVYWARFHHLYPFVHRHTLEGSGEDVLRCAMAAVATQFLDGKEDRARGNLLHEYAWQEAKRVSWHATSHPVSDNSLHIHAVTSPGLTNSQHPQWSLQVMQAILLCELFARFRGRKAVVRPSKLFESLYSRVSGSQSLIVSSSSSFSDSASFFPAPVSLSESSIPSSLSSSSFSLYSPTPAWSPSEPPSASSPEFGGMDAFFAPKDYGSFDQHGSNQDHHHQHSLLFSPSVSFSPSTVIDTSPPFVFDPLFRFDNASFPSSSAPPPAQSYLGNFSSQVLDHNSTMFDPAHAGSAQHSMGVNGSNNEFINLSMTKEERWHNWLETEGRRRLLASCFLIDGHTSVYHGQARARDDILHSEIPLTGPSDTLWAANSADEWAATLDTNPSAGIPQFLPHPASLTPEGVAERSIFDQCAILNAEARNLPRNDNVSSVMSHQQSGNTGRESSLGAAEERIGWLFRGLPISGVSNTFLALHHTPLRDLLAVSGDSWVFSQKVLEQPTFAEYQRRLRLWLNNSNTSGSNPANLFASSAPTSALDVGNMSVGKATIYASRALLAFLNRPTESNGITPRAACVSDYWAMYVCALIIWAFGRHRAGRSPSSNNSGDSVPSSATSSNTNNHGESEERAVNWLRAVSELSRPEDVTRVRGRREASLGVVGLVKRRLEADCVPGSRARLYVDAVGVLRKLEEGVNWKWF